MANDNSGPKRQKRAVLTTVAAAQNTSLKSQASSGGEPSSTGKEFDYLLRWQGNGSDRDEIIEWDKEEWSEDQEHEEDEEDDADHSRSSLSDMEDATDRFVYNDLDTEEAAIQQARQQLQTRGRKVPLETVVKIINESMEAFAEQWYPGRETELTGKEKEQSLNPLHLWEEAEAHGRREELIERYRFDIQYFKNSLDRLSEEICKLQSSEKQIRQQCKNLEVHVHNLEEAKWYLSIYELPPANESGGDSDREEQNQAAAHEPPRQQKSEVIDLGSSPESSIHDDDRETLSHVETSAVVSRFDQENKDEMTIDHKTSTNPPRTDAGKTTDPAGVTTNAHPGDFTEMDLDDTHPVTPNVPTVRSLTVTRKTSLISEPEIVASIEPGAAPFSPTASPRPQKPTGSKPEIASILTISKWDMADLISTKDRKRLVMKVMLNMNRQEREMIRTRISAVKKSNLLREVRTCIDMLYRKKERMLGVLSSDLPKVKTVTYFFLCWWLVGDYMNKTPTEQQLHELVTNLHDCDDLETFYKWVCFILHKIFTEEAFRSAHEPSQEEVIVISDDEKEEERPSATSSSRKKQLRKQVQARHVPQQDIIMLD